MQNTMRAHSARQISMEGSVDVNKGHMVYRNIQKFYPVVQICLYFLHGGRKNL